jgi:hypothetical protein
MVRSHSKAPRCAVSLTTNGTLATYSRPAVPADWRHLLPVLPEPAQQAERRALLLLRGARSRGGARLQHRAARDDRDALLPVAQNEGPHLPGVGLGHLPGVPEAVPDALGLHRAARRECKMGFGDSMLEMLRWLFLRCGDRGWFFWVLLPMIVLDASQRRPVARVEWVSGTHPESV